ncbi:MAG: NADPH:quinone oxidoreductase family protein [Parvibaculales bacterium]
MKAVLCKEHGLPETLVMEEIDAPVPGKGEILLDVHSAAVNFPDYLIIQNKYQMKPELPFSPGSEVAGRVAALGEGVDGLKVGDKVLGLCGFNGFREQTTLPAAACVPMPDAMTYNVGASLIMTYGTSYHALKQRAQLQPGETIFIMGASGGVGLAAVDLAKTMGAKVIAAASTEEKLALCRDYGADETLLYPTGDMDKEEAKAFSAQIKELSGGKGVDVIYDPVGDAYAEPAIRAMAWNGRYLVIGFAAGEIPKIPLNLTLLKGCSIVGVFWGQFTFMEAELSAQNNRELMAMEADGRIKPHVSKVFAFDQTPEAIAHIGARQATGKVVVEIRS